MLPIVAYKAVRVVPVWVALTDKPSAILLIVLVLQAAYYSVQTWKCISLVR